MPAEDRYSSQAIDREPTDPDWVTPPSDLKQATLKGTNFIHSASILALHYASMIEENKDNPNELRELQLRLTGILQDIRREVKHQVSATTSQPAPTDDPPCCSYCLTQFYQCGQGTTYCQTQYNNCRRTCNTNC